MDTTKSSFPTNPQTGGYAGVEPDSSTRVQDGVDRAAQGMHQAVDRVAERAKPSLQRVQDGLDHGSQLLHQGADQVREMADEWTTTLRGTVREHPLAAVATALLFGMLLGRVTR